MGSESRGELAADELSDSDRKRCSDDEPQALSSSLHHSRARACRPNTRPQRPTVKLVRDTFNNAYLCY